MAPMNLAAFRTQCRVQTRDHATTPTYATDAVVDFAVNKAVEDINSITRSINTSNIGSPIATVVGTRLYAIPTGMQDIYALLYKGKELPFVQIGEMPTYYGTGWFDIVGEPQCWYVEDQQIGLYPRSSVNGADIVLMSVKLPTPMTDPAHVTGMDSRLDLTVLYWACEYIMTSRREPDMAAQFHSKWLEALQKYQAVQLNKRVRGGRTFLNFGWTP